MPCWLVVRLKRVCELGPLNSRFLLVMGGCMGCSVGFYLFGSSRGVCRIVGLVWAIPRKGEVGYLWCSSPCLVVVPVGSS
jgi:hypothetical protein